MQKFVEQVQCHKYLLPIPEGRNFGDYAQFVCDGFTWRREQLYKLLGNDIESYSEETLKKCVLTLTWFVYSQARQEVQLLSNVMDTAPIFEKIQGYNIRDAFASEQEAFDFLQEVLN